MRTLPATTALSPSSAARLKTFEPITTPTPTFEWLETSAAIAVEISGASAPRAVRIPCSPSDAPRRSLTSSSFRAKTRLAPRLAAMLAQKTRTASPTDIRRMLFGRSTRPCGRARQPRPSRARPDARGAPSRAARPPPHRAGTPGARLLSRPRGTADTPRRRGCSGGRRSTSPSRPDSTSRAGRLRIRAVDPKEQALRALYDARARRDWGGVAELLVEDIL